MNISPFPTIWPAALAEFLLASYGTPSAVTQLGGMSGAGVWRVEFAVGSVIVKRARDREVRFYQQVAATIAAQGVAVPDLYWADADWLVLEDMGARLPRERWLADAEMLATLRRLHRVQLEREPAWPLFRPAWGEGMSEAALSHFPVDVAGELRAPLADLRGRAQGLFGPRGYISGDPNPLNWGVRADGTLVLFDWERFGCGSAAIDLAITVPSLGTRADYRLVASRYLATPADDVAVQRLAHKIALAKVWVIIEFLSAAADGTAAVPAAVVAMLVNSVPAWLREVALYHLFKQVKQIM